jgi:hypothetical protein
MREPTQRPAAQFRNRREIAHHIKLRLARHQRIKRMGRSRAEQDRIAIGPRARHLKRTNRTARTAAIFRHHRLAQFAAQALSIKPRIDIGGTTGREGDDHADRARGISLLRPRRSVDQRRASAHQRSAAANFKAPRHANSQPPHLGGKQARRP